MANAEFKTEYEPGELLGAVIADVLRQAAELRRQGHTPSTVRMSDPTYRTLERGAHLYANNASTGRAMPTIAGYPLLVDKDWVLPPTVEALNNSGV